MNHTCPQASPIPHPSDCPVCRKPAVRETHKVSITGLRTSLYHCEAAHLWELRWTEAA